MIFLAVLICVAIYTLYKTYKRVVEHNKMAEKLREVATHNIRTKAVTQMLLDRTQTHLWELNNGVFSIINFDSGTLDDAVSIEGMRSVFSGSAFYKRKVEEFFQI